MVLSCCDCWALSQSSFFLGDHLRKRGSMVMDMPNLRIRSLSHSVGSTKRAKDRMSVSKFQERVIYPILRTLPEVFTYADLSCGTSPSHQPINQSTNQPINQSTINQSTNQPINYLPIIQPYPARLPHRSCRAANPRLLAEKFAMCLITLLPLH